MTRFLLVLMSLVFSTTAVAAEKCKAADGREMYCFEPKEAKRLLEIVDVEVPSLKRQIEKKDSIIEAQKALMETKDERVKVQEEISKRWKENFESVSANLSEENRSSRIDAYIDIGIFLFGTLVGSGMMYTSSLLLANAK